MTLFILPREKWRARQPTNTTLRRGPAEHVFLASTGGTGCTNSKECKEVIQRLQRDHIEKHYQRDIRYNFVIGGDGRIYEGRGWKSYTYLPAIYKSFERSSLTICFIGDYTSEDLPDDLYKLGLQLIDYGIEQLYIDKDFTPHEIFDIETSDMRDSYYEKNLQKLAF